jgi:hypothetical protein
MRQIDGRWQIVGRELHENAWRPIETLAGERGHALFPAAAASGGSVTLVFEDHAADPQRIAMRRWDGRAWSAVDPVSSARLPAYRPVVAGDSVLWDEYSRADRAYRVHARRVRPSPGADEVVSPAGANCLKAAALALADGRLYAAWVNDEDVRGGAGVVDHQDGVQVAVRRDGRWTPFKGSAGSGRAAWLPSVASHGCSGSVRPSPTARRGLRDNSAARRSIPLPRPSSCTKDWSNIRLRRRATACW